jgi:hypothetical protein
VQTDINFSNKSSRGRVTQAQKNANDFAWYKEQCDLLDHRSSDANFSSFGGVSNYHRLKTNYDLFNNIINPADFTYVCQPYGAQVGELPANFTNRDIVSGKIKVLLGMEMKMPFSWKVVAINEEATTRKEQHEWGMIRDFVVSQIMTPLRTQIEQQVAEQTKGKKLSPDEQQQIQAQIEDQLAAKTPDEVRKYMAREHQDPAEALLRQLTEYLLVKKNVPFKFNKGWKHSNLSGSEFYWVGERNNEPDMIPVNPMFFEHDISPDLDFVEDGEWAKYEYRMTPSEVVANFGSKLTNEQIDRIYQFNNDPSRVADVDFTFDNRDDDAYTVRVLHTNFVALKKIGFLSYLDNSGNVHLDLVDELYRLDHNHGDIRIEWEWIPEVHECYKILSDIYVYCRPVPGQTKTLDNLWEHKLSYYGASCDSLNSPTTSPMDRMKAYQYYYDIIIYRMELLMASDKGKILAANIKAVPKSSGIDITKFSYFMEANHIAWLNPSEEGLRGGGDITNMVKEIDMSLVSSLDKYIQVAEFIAQKCGASIGVTPQMEAQIGPNDAVTNTKQNLVQASYIIQPYFELHNTVKSNVLNALLKCAVDTYSRTKPKKLSYVLDDMSMKVLEVDPELLEETLATLYVANSSKAADAKQAVENLSQAAMQNQQADLGDIIKVIKSNSVNEAEELLEAARQRKVVEEQHAATLKTQADKEAAQRADQLRRDEWAHEEKLVVLKETERRKTELQKQAMLSTGFDPNKDEDNDGEPDVLEIYKHGLDVEIKTRKQDLEENKFNHQVQQDQQTNKLAKEKLQIDRTKANKPSGSAK